MEKLLLTKTQAVSILAQIKGGKNNINPFNQVDEKHSLFEKSCEELEVQLKRFVGNISAVVEDPVILEAT